MSFGNPFLREAMRVIRRDRPRLSPAVPYFNRVEIVPSGKYAEVWFTTDGCTWDHEGGCTMCNYGRGQVLAPDETVSVVQSALRELPDGISELLVSPSGGFFDERELPAAARRGVLAAVRSVPCDRFLIETRVETVTETNVAELRGALPGRALGIEVGLESSDGWIQRFCVNKGTDGARFRRAAAVAHAHDVALYSNVCLGTAFLTQGEAIDDAARSVIWSLENGADVAVLFPLHVKPYTLLATLRAGGRYQPISLWSLAAVLERVAQHDDAFPPRTEIAWYKSYYSDPSKISDSPGTCDRCYSAVLGLLDAYRARLDLATINALVSFECSCKSPWRGRVSAAAAPLPSRVLEHYRWIAAATGLDDWWALHGAAIERSMYEHAASGAA